MKYRESLPNDCPPHDAEEITAPMTVFRLVRGEQPTDADFHSLRAKKPNFKFSAGECEARGLSVFSVYTDVISNVQKIPKFRNHLVCRVQLRTGSGKIKQTGNKSHHTWWPLAKFDILPNCKVEKS